MITDFFAITLFIQFILNILFACTIIFFEKKETSSTWAWIMVLVFIPYVGFILYLVLGKDSRKYKVFAEKSKEDDNIYKDYLHMDINGIEFTQNQIKNLTKKNILKEPDTSHLNNLIYLNYIAGDGAFTKNNKVKIFNEGNAKFESLFNDIDKARYFIHIQYYIIRNDDLGQRIIKALVNAKNRGVEVKLMVDGMGCQFTDKSFYKPLTDALGELCVFLPPFLVRINFRNHRKICIIDGKIGYIGGLNIGDEYLGKVKRYGYWRDSHIRISGDAVKQLQLRFIMDWNFCSKNKILLDKKYFPSFPSLPIKKNGVDIQIVSSGPDTKWSNIQYSYFKMITEADKSIYIQTPYFIPDESIFEALRIAALSGVDVRIIIPANPDHLFVYWASLSHLGQLLEAGVKCYKYKKGFLHSKLLMIDTLSTSVGTANMDIRSFKLNFEINAFIYDKNITEIFEKDFLKDLNDCEEITVETYNSRSTFTKIKESISRLLSPLL